MKKDEKEVIVSRSLVDEKNQQCYSVNYDQRLTVINSYEQNLFKSLTCGYFEF